jgi:DNA-binding NarL/FixJ family response regulator
MIRILLADDHAILRHGLVRVLSDGLPGATFGETDSATGALELLRRSAWDLLILDIGLPGRNGFEVLAEVARDCPLLPVLVLSSTPEDQLGVRALRAGAAGYLNKQAAPELLLAAVQRLLAGKRFVSPALAEQLAAEIRRDDDRPRHEDLSDRERQVCIMSARGLAVKEIAAELCLSPKTVSTFRTRIFAKLGLRNDADLANYVRDHRLN